MDDLELAVVTELDEPKAEEIATLVARASTAHARAALSEHKRMQLDRLTGSAPRPAESSEVTAGIVGRRAGGGVLVGYAQLTGDHAARDFAVELVIDPELVDAAGLADALLARSLDQVHQLGGGTLRWWVAHARPADDALARAHGFVTERDLLQMRCPLPLPDAPAGDHAAVTIVTRPFRVGVDEQAWLEVNNRAFAAHPEQGGWTLATLAEREQEAWFDPDGLLLLEENGVVVGSCWTKVHADVTPPMGEIYVIGVDPAFHGRGWGRALTVAGLHWLAEQGLTVGMLYVDGDNGPAVHLYRSLGFTQHHVDRAYRRIVDGP